MKKLCNTFDSKYEKVKSTDHFLHSVGKPRFIITRCRLGLIEAIDVLHVQSIAATHSVLLPLMIMLPV